jgi:hypothetical protein
MLADVQAAGRQRDRVEHALDRRRLERAEERGRVGGTIGAKRASSFRRTT